MRLDAERRDFVRYFDLHCDTMTECYVKGKHIDKNDLHIDCQRAAVFDSYVQCYAVWMPDSVCGEAAFSRFKQVSNRFSEEVRSNEQTMVQCRDPGDLARNEGKHCAVLSVENAAALGGKLENIVEFARLGVKLCSLTWNGENELGRGVRASGDGGITPFGRQVVKELENNHIVVDLSHASPELFYDVVSMARGPVAATHSNAKSVCKSARNLSDEQFNTIRSSGGLVGLNLYKGFLNDDPDKASLYDVLRHAEHFLSLGGEDILAVGADWDGSEKKDFVSSGLEGVPELYELFLRHNYPETLADKIFYKNAADFFKNEDLL